MAARAEILPAKGAIDSRIREVAYNSQQVYRLTGFVGYQIDLQFEPGETFVADFGPFGSVTVVVT